MGDRNGMAVREPVVAGQFYSSSKERLTEELKEYFPAAGARQSTAVISPHAGYIYSGRTAAHAVSALRPSKTVIILGTNHYSQGKALSIHPAEAWLTPLGEMYIDADVKEQLLRTGLAEEGEIEHIQEHSIEVQLPFIQYMLGGDAKFVPVSVIGSAENKRYEAFGKALAGMLRSNQGLSVLASSDFSHYLPLDEARAADRPAIERILATDMPGFLDVVRRRSISICGAGPIAVLLSMAGALGLRAVVIHESSSADASGDTSQVVTYYAIGFE